MKYFFHLTRGGTFKQTKERKSQLVIIVKQKTPNHTFRSVQKLQATQIA